MCVCVYLVCWVNEWWEKENWARRRKKSCFLAESRPATTCILDGCRRDHSISCTRSLPNVGSYILFFQILFWNQNFFSVVVVVDSFFFLLFQCFVQVLKHATQRSPKTEKGTLDKIKKYSTICCCNIMRFISRFQ